MIICSTKSVGQGQYEIGYQPVVKGKHQLHIKVEEQHISGSPFSVAVKPSIENLGTPLLTVGGVDCPFGIAINHEGEMVLTECNGNCISVFSPNGKKLRQFGEIGSGYGEFFCPQGVTTDNQNNIYVADSGNHRIQKFSAQGQFLKAVDGESLKLNYPRDISFNPTNGRLYIADNNSIQVLNLDFASYNSFRKKGSNDSMEFIAPFGIACDCMKGVCGRNFQQLCPNLHS